MLHVYSGNALTKKIINQELAAQIVFLIEMFLIFSKHLH